MAKEKHYNEADESGFLFWKRQSIKAADGSKYLERLIVLRCRFGGIFFHRIYASDVDCMHDHPWNFWSLIIKGGYFEETPEGEKWYGARSLLYRPAEWIHRLRVEKPAWTLVFTTPKKRTWGFITPRGWEHWKKHPHAMRCE